MPNPSTYFKGKFSSKAPVACVIDTSLPTFAGIASVTPQSDGSFVVTWVSATGTKTPIRYEIYAALGSVSAATLFVTANRVAFGPGAVTSWRLFCLRDQLTFFNQGSIYTFGIRAVDAQNFVDTNTVILTAVCSAINYGTVAAAVWDQLQSAHTVAGSFGLALDAAISSRAPAATALSTVQWTNARAALLDFLDVATSTRAPAATALSTAQWTNARAALLDFLDVAVSSRAPASTALSTAQWTNVRAGLLDFLDVAVSSRAPSATALSTAQWTNARAALIDFLDAAVSSRLAAASYTAPDNSDIVAIKAQTDKFLFDGSNFVKADAVVTIDDANILAIKAKTDNLPADPASNTQVNTRVATSHFDTVIGTPAGASIAADIAEVEAETDGIAAIPTNPLLTSDARLAHLDADVSSRLPTSSYVAPDNADVVAIKAKTDQLTFTGSNVNANAQVEIEDANILAIKAKTDNLPADPASNTQVNTRLAASSYVAPDNADIVAIKAKTDNLPADPASNTQVNTRLASNDSRLNDLDAPISSRLPTSSYVAPDNADITNIKAKTDQLNFTGTDVNAHTNNITPINVQQIVDGVLNEPIASHNSAGSVGHSIGQGGTGGGGGGGTVFRGRIVSPERLTGKILNPQRLRGVVIQDD